MQLNTEALKKLTPFISLILFCIAAYAVHHQIVNYGWGNLWVDLLATPSETLETMFFMSAFGYITLSLCEWIAIRYSQEKLPYRLILLGSFLSNAISHNVGASPISGGAIRYRFYNEWGLSNSAIAKITVFGTLSYFLSAFTLLIIASLIEYDSPPIESELAKNTYHLLLIIGVCFLAGWIALSCFSKKQFTFRTFTISPPSPSLALQQIAVGALDLTIASIVLYIPLLNFTDISFSEFLIYYVVAQLFGLISQVPGGIGIFEGGFMYLAGSRFPPEQLLSALIIYRIVYYIIPLFIAGLLIVAYETKSHRFVYTLKLHYLFKIVHLATPKIFSVLLLIGGSVLLVSGATPGIQERLDWLQFFLPLPLIEFSHLVNSLVGLGMIFLSRAVGLKLDSAYYATIILLSVGIIVSLAKGWDFEEASILGIMLIAFIPTRKNFYRKSALLKMEIPWTQLFIGVGIVGLSTWLGFFSYKDVAYSNDLWWQFSLDRSGDASRFLRSLFVISVVCGGLLIYRLMSKTVIDLRLPTKDELDIATQIVHNSSTTDHHLVLTGDKYIMWSKTQKSFLMYGVTNKFWIAMGDPVGDPSEFDELVWRFRESADKVAAQIAFYEIGIKSIPLYLDLGLSLIKLGQQALIPLNDFGLEGKKRQNFRSAINKYQREGFTFEIVYAHQVEAILPNLRKISDAWLKEKNAKEKRFSLGFFNEEYLRHCELAVVKKDDEIYAFCNLWAINNRHQISIDLMRYLPGTPNGIMEYLNISLAMWAKEQGFTYFCLGMAPLSGLENHALAPLWHKIGNTIFRIGGDFYNFEGVYFYKEKFNPKWQPVYLAAPPGLQTASALLAATTLISGGVTGIFSK
ncbi:MAG: bifunctional lysylphosphatidylglycerol flippase/synthetase MprF [Gammaproteobacteria bacterium]|nr:MAG: bifunctional lysylphosphatidylglycerol flippase/synthetase MprF [Gammaproteobacteria bacterium]